jgi:hypothetical protein
MDNNKAEKDESKRRRRPPVLFLWFDNASVNKSECVFRFCAFLVFCGIFEKVRVGFLMVGHTHDIVDRMFSRISTFLQNHNIMSVQQYLQELPKAFHTADAVTKPKQAPLSHAADADIMMLDNDDDDEAMLQSEVLRYVARADASSAKQRQVAEEETDEAQRQPLSVLHLTSVAAWDEWLDPIACPIFNTKPFHQFKFTFNTGKTVVNMDTRFLAEWNRLDIDSKWRSKWRVAVIKKDEVDKASHYTSTAATVTVTNTVTVSDSPSNGNSLSRQSQQSQDDVEPDDDNGESDRSGCTARGAVTVSPTRVFHSDPAIIPPLPASFDAIKSTIAHFYNDGAGKLNSQLYKDWMDYINEWSPEAMKSRAPCATCHELLTQLRHSKVNLSRCKRPRVGIKLDEREKMTLNAASSNYRQQRNKLNGHLQSIKHTRPTSTWSNCMLARMKHDAKDEHIDLLPGVIVNRGKLYTQDGRLHEPVLGNTNLIHIISDCQWCMSDCQWCVCALDFCFKLGPCQKEAQAESFDFRKRLSELEVNYFVALPSKPDDDKYPFYLVQLSDYEASTKRAEGYYLQRHLIDEEEWWASNPDKSSLTLQQKLQQAASWHWQTMERIDDSNHRVEFSLTQETVLCWHKPATALIKPLASHSTPYEPNDEVRVQLKTLSSEYTALIKSKGVKRAMDSIMKEEEEGKQRQRQQQQSKKRGNKSAAAAIAAADTVTEDTVRLSEGHTLVKQAERALWLKRNVMDYKATIHRVKAAFYTQIQRQITFCTRKTSTTTTATATAAAATVVTVAATATTLTTARLSAAPMVVSATTATTMITCGGSTTTTPTTATATETTAAAATTLSTLSVPTSAGPGAAAAPSQSSDLSSRRRNARRATVTTATTVTATSMRTKRAAKDKSKTCTTPIQSTPAQNCYNELDDDDDDDDDDVPLIDQV